MVKESFKLIESNMPKSEIAELIVKHWKIAIISKAQAKYLDTKTEANLKNTMPENWDYKTGDTFARLDKAGIRLQPF
jgi:ABC-type transport system involved in Fe-S cluster assembly fused permease/ATPase subunit